MKMQNDWTISRRNFLKGVSSGGAAATTTWLLGEQLGLAYASGGSTGQAWGVLIDLTRCTGCNSCALACKESNHLPHPDTVPEGLCCEAYTCVDAHQVAGTADEYQTIYVKRQCMHCVHPACVSACTVGALRKTPGGPVVYDAKKCIGCRYCQYACPFGIPTYEWQDPLGLIGKCQFCFSRLSEGQKPACADACPNGALRFGFRDALLAQALGQIVSNPGRYVDHVYGEHEVGGTSMLYLSPVPFEELGFSALGSEPIPHYAEAVMKRTPFMAVTVASAASGLYWFLKRRDQKLASVRVSATDVRGEK